MTFKIFLIRRKVKHSLSAKISPGLITFFSRHEIQFCETNFFLENVNWTIEISASTEIGLFEATVWLVGWSVTSSRFQNLDGKMKKRAWRICGRVSFKAWLGLRKTERRLGQQWESVWGRERERDSEREIERGRWGGENKKDKFIERGFGLKLSGEWREIQTEMRGYFEGCVLSG